MEYPPTQPHLIAIHELRKEMIYEKHKASFQQILDMAGTDLFAQLEVYGAYISDYGDMGHSADAQQVLEMVRKLPKSNEPRVEAFKLFLEAQNLTLKSELTLSKSHIDNALALLNDDSCVLHYRLQYARAYIELHKNNYDEVIKLSAKIIDSGRSDSSLMAKIHTLLGLTYIYINLIGEGERHFQSALNIYLESGDVRGIAMAYANLAFTAGSRFRVDPTDRRSLHDGIRYFKLSLKTIEHSSVETFKASALGQLSQMYADAKNFSAAIKYGNKGLLLARSRSLKYLPQAIGAMADLYQRVGNYLESLHLCEEALTYFDVLNVEEKSGLYELLAINCKNLGWWEKAYEYAQLNIQFRDEVHQREKAGILSHSELMAEQLRTQEAKLYELKVRTVEDKMQMQAAQLVSQTELLSRFRDELREIARQYPSNDPGWRAVKEKLKELPCKQIDWEKFEAEFRAVHPEFTNKLYERYPTLTPTEVKMCSLVRLNLKSHEIARLFCVTERAVEFHRLNIRKKCGIPKEQSLSVFLNNL